MAEPFVIVEFYSNFHFVEVDISGIHISPASDGEEPRTYDVEEAISERVSGPEHDEFPVIEEKDYTEGRQALYTLFKMSVIASSGTWGFKLHFGSGHYEIGPIPYIFDASVVSAFIPPALADPGNPGISRLSVKGEGVSLEESGPFFMTVVDVEPGVVEFRLFAFGGTSLGGTEGGITIERLSELGPVIVEEPAFDVETYELELEEGPCGGGTEITVPEGATRVGGARSGRGRVGRKVGGNRA
jgi:hypothetical protein